MTWLKDKWNKLWRWIVIGVVGTIAFAQALTPTLCESVPVETPSGRYLYFSNWEWDAKNEFWHAPGGGQVGLLDLRTLPEMGTKAIVSGYGFFVYDIPKDIKGGCYLGKDLDRVLTAGEKAELKTMFKLSATPTSNTIRDFVWDILGKYSDPTGQTAPKPLMPDSKLNMDLHLGGFSIIKTEKFDINTHPNKDKVLAVLQENYRKARQNNAPYKQYLDTLELKYKTNYRTFIPPDLPDEGKLPHQTTVTDSFTDTTGTSLDAHTADTGGTWVEVVGNWSITANQATQGGLDRDIARHTGALSTDDMTYQVTAVAYNPTNGQIGATCRNSTDAAPNQDQYQAFTLVGFINAHKIVNGTQTDIGSNTAISESAPDDIKCSADGSTIRAYFNGTDITGGTDTAITGNLFAGMMARRSGDIIDDFTASDIVAAAAPAGVPYQADYGDWDFDE